MTSSNKDTRLDGVGEDIVDRLHSEADLCANDGADDICDLLIYAADEIGRLRADMNEIRRLLSYAQQDAVSAAVAQANLNAAYHVARNSVSEEKES